MKVLIVANTEKRARQYAPLDQERYQEFVCESYADALKRGTKELQEFIQVVLADRENAGSVTLGEALEHLGFELRTQETVAAYIYER